MTAQQLFQHEFAMHDAAMRAASAYVYESFGDAEATVLAGSPCSLVQQQRMRQATTYATRIAADAARFAYTWAGTDALRNPSVLQRCFRDIHAGTQHIYVDNNTLTAYTQTLLAAPARRAVSARAVRRGRLSLVGVARGRRRDGHDPLHFATDARHLRAAAVARRGTDRRAFHGGCAVSASGTPPSRSLRRPRTAARRVLCRPWPP